MVILKSKTKEFEDNLLGVALACLVQANYIPLGQSWPPSLS
jgi:hypothetical protein